MKVARSQYVTTKSETQLAILDWLQATEEFHRNYLKISEVIRQQTSSRANWRVSGFITQPVKDLIKLRRHMNIVLETLLVDMGKSPMASQYTNNPTSYYSKTGQLKTHARLLKEISYKTNLELQQFSAFRA